MTAKIKLKIDLSAELEILREAIFQEVMLQRSLYERKNGK